MLKKHIKTTSLFFGICIAVVLLFSGVASAANYYVALDGDDSNTGSEAQPWETIQKAADTLTAGDTVYIKSGTYNERVTPRNSGSAGNYITYTAYPGDTVTIDGTDIPVYPNGLVQIEQKSYIKVSGLRIENFRDGGACAGIYIYNGCDHIIIEDNFINNIDGCGIYTRYDVSNLIIDNNEVCYTNLDLNWKQEMLSLTFTDTFVVKNNYLHDSNNIAIDMKRDTSNGEVYNNHVYNCESGIYPDARGYVANIDIYQNVVHDCLGAGFILGTESGGILENINLYNNIAYNNNDGLQIANYLSNAPDGSHMKKNINVINNIFCDNSASAMHIVDYGEHFQDFTIRNNILSGNKWGMINFPRIVEENVNIDHNLFTAECDVLGDDYIIGDPEFVNPSEGDFRLQEDSPAIDNGLSVDAPGEDFDRNKRPQGTGYDIGAFEYVNDVVTGTISGTVTDRSTNPIQGASVSDGTRSATTDGTGSYSISDVPAGTYTVTCTKAGYQSASEDNIVVSEGAVATVDISLTSLLPTADFSASPTCGQEPLTVSFTDNSISYDGIEAWEWDFDNDGETDSTEQNPTHVYTEDGEYTVTLAVTESDGGSDTMTKADYITVTEVNNAPYTPENPSPYDGATDVSIDEALSWTGGDPDDEDTVTYDIYFGTSITPPLVAENQPGTTYDPDRLDHNTEYYWRVVAKDNHGASKESGVWSFVSVSSPDPDLVADWHLDAGSGETAVDSSGNGNDGTLVNNPTWVSGKVGNGLSFDGTNDYVDCGQDTSLAITGAITVEAWVKWSGDGNPYFVTKFGGSGHRSYDLSGNTDGTVEFRVGGEDCNTVKSSGAAPIPIGEWVYLVGTYEPSSYVRLFVNGALAEEDTASIPASQGDNGLSWCIGSREGNQGWFNGIIDEVKIHNGALSAEEIRENYDANPTNRPPVADPKGPYIGTEGVVIAYDGSGSYDLDGSIVDYEWDFGDGNTATGVAPTHTYAHNGTYPVSLAVTDNDGATDTYTTTATIADTEPTADFSASPTSGRRQLTVEFTDNSASYNGIEAWEWDFDNDGETDSTEQNPIHVYTRVGVYTVSLTVYESDGASDTMTKDDYIKVTRMQMKVKRNP